MAFSTGFFINASTGGYYEGDRMSALDLAVPQRPSQLYVWTNGAWAIDPTLQAAANTAAQLVTDQATVMTDPTVTAFLAMTPAQIDAWITANVVDIPGCVKAFKIVGKLIRTLTKRDIT